MKKTKIIADAPPPQTFTPPGWYNYVDGDGNGNGDGDPGAEAKAKEGEGEGEEGKENCICDLEAELMTGNWNTLCPHPWHKK